MVRGITWAWQQRVTWLPSRLHVSWLVGGAALTVLLCCAAFLLCLCVFVCADLPDIVAMVYGSLFTHLVRIPYAGWVNEMHFVHGKRLFWALTCVTMVQGLASRADLYSRLALTCFAACLLLARWVLCFVGAVAPLASCTCSARTPRLVRVVWWEKILGRNWLAHVCVM